MNRKPLFLRALLLLILAIGPLQAQVVFACAMMDTVVHHECCCDDKADDGCANPDCDVTLEAGDVPCCEQSVEVSVDQNVGKDTLSTKPAEVRSDVDPPQAHVAPADALFPPDPFHTLGTFHYRTAAGQSGSDTYLITQRLRI